MTPLERRIMDTAKEMNMEYELDEVRQISYSIENSEEYDDLITSEMKKHINYGREI